jgi:maleylpyruvate isomerase
MMRLHAYYRSSASYRVRLALAHKALSYDVVPVSLREGSQLAAAHLAKNPIGQVPVLELATEAGPVHLNQSLAILEYLEEVYPEAPLLPKLPIDRARARELAELVNSGIQPLQNLSVLKHVKHELGGDENVWARHFIARGLAALEKRAEITAGAFLVGDAPSFADLCLVPQLYNARRYEVSLDTYPTLTAVEARCAKLPRWELAHPDRQPDAPSV